ncbi:MAG: hypothetical protein FIB07_12530 [Candidatus Methanoperedens sp.]|nr:hypothetical protein [Candidatus Methanoperedens sp.]
MNENENIINNPLFCGKQPGQKILLKIDWDALDSAWADLYREDYGYLFSSTFFSNNRINIQAAHIETGMVDLA